ncbi:hypothetical protein I6A84_17475 [Frankia sp. CNm7]|uniref:Recombination endonuclease VII n=1 Tax=Frankia nepalensis TaxID=1836974 RepID=A0A937RA37_9ACTN|nr:endonuclease VII domain-containing protein [Frankia nepalensis]MBL7495215.1 hypothetical protein [Frankia nepalensis]MBL7511731.1 hypothetical protein [Frankia nepalensis]MBL7519838.1 hypothetical protein [Frankia nepalensis]MBL7628236.1 hypothetical protein [Frankia nepalensis]
MTLKTCRDCGVAKPLEQFHPHAQMKDGRHNYCVECYRRRNRERYQRKKAGDLRDGRRTRPLEFDGYRVCPDCGERKPASEFATRKRASDGLHTYCRPCNNARAYASIERLHGTSRNWKLKERYGLTAEQVAQMVADQGGMCAICEERPAEHVDHDHATGVVRGVLCFTCNVGLGTFEDDPTRLLDAMRYLWLWGAECLAAAWWMRMPSPSRAPGGDADVPGDDAWLSGINLDRLFYRRKGLSPGEMAKMIEIQAGGCAVCGTESPEHVDHDHATGKVRGILCFGCNTGMGSFGDDPDRLARAARYLRPVVTTT